MNPHLFRGPAPDSCAGTDAGSFGITEHRVPTSPTLHPYHYDLPADEPMTGCESPVDAGRVGSHGIHLPSSVPFFAPTQPLLALLLPDGSPFEEATWYRQ